MIPLSNLVNAVLMLFLIAWALLRLTDGNRESYFERVALLMIAAGAFFQLAKLHDPEGTPPDLLLFRLGFTLYILYHSLAWLRKYLSVDDYDDQL